ncbi:hypothetical protein AVEN_59923-1 [Araneus ventricosus]|uniref:Uncharacterized protein n=1 Tax=Araneus ventricosus TaxID=182803 RepID=A0A4Y2UXX0_ARAVE|nr:hypothetical protein AVEN_8167-1 [Araneus ventricosus]GBO16994.1 hypothetical protein AVEN_59923-1 [Araneus ventricosus]
MDTVAVTVDLSRLPNKTSLIQQAKTIMTTPYCEGDESLSNSSYSEEDSKEILEEKSLTPVKLAATKIAIWVPPSEDVRSSRESVPEQETSRIRRQKCQHLHSYCAVIFLLSSLFKTTRKLFLDGPRNFESYV